MPGKFLPLRPRRADEEGTEVTCPSLWARPSSFQPLLAPHLVRVCLLAPLEMALDLERLWERRTGEPGVYETAISSDGPHIS